jgi:hypothetical protein
LVGDGRRVGFNLHLWLLLVRGVEQTRANENGIEKTGKNGGGKENIMNS